MRQIFLFSLLVGLLGGCAGCDDRRAKNVNASANISLGFISNINAVAYQETPEPAAQMPQKPIEQGATGAVVITGAANETAANATETRSNITTVTPNCLAANYDSGTGSWSSRCDFAIDDNNLRVENRDGAYLCYFNGVECAKSPLCFQPNDAQFAFRCYDSATAWDDEHHVVTIDPSRIQTKYNALTCTITPQGADCG
jgi:hypothetical protein